MSRKPRTLAPAGQALVADIQRMNGAAALLMAVFAVLVLIAAGALAMRHPMFNVSAIQMAGDLSRNSAATLRANVMSRLRGNFFTLDLGETRAAFESVPWVRHAVVKREFPNRLTVVLHEHQPIARWGSDGEPYLVNHLGEVFEVSQGDVEAQNLPSLKGPAGQASLLLQGYQMLSPVFDKLDLVVEALELSRQGNWRALLDNGAVVDLGHGSLSDITVRSLRFIDTVTQVSSRYGRSLESADLRYPNGYAIKLRGVTTVSASDVKDNKVKR